MRPLRRPAALLAILCLLGGLSGAQAAPAPLRGLQAVHTGRAFTVAWAPPPGQDLVCVLRVSGTDELMEPCATGPDAASVALAVSRDAGLQVRPGDVLAVRAYDRRRSLIAVGEVAVQDAWRLWFPWVDRAR